VVGVQAAATVRAVLAAAAATVAGSTGGSSRAGGCASAPHRLGRAWDTACRVGSLLCQHWRPGWEQGETAPRSQKQGAHGCHEPQ